jgi:hypothetical protein
MDIILAVVFLVIVLGVVIAFFVRGMHFFLKFRNVECGMSYEEVVSLIGDPSDLNTSEDITTCVWKRTVFRDWTIRRTVTFEKGKVLHIVES